MSKITENLYLGSYNEAGDRHLLVKKKIKGIIVCGKYL